jgi:hypothetical protein
LFDVGDDATQSPRARDRAVIGRRQRYRVAASGGPRDPTGNGVQSTDDDFASAGTPGWVAHGRGPLVEVGFVPPPAIAASQRQLAEDAVAEPGQHR